MLFISLQLSLHPTRAKKVARMLDNLKAGACYTHKSFSDVLADAFEAHLATIEARAAEGEKP